MRLVLAALLLAASLAAARAATIEQSRIDAIDQATAAFLARAAADKKAGLVPRQSDPVVGPLLDTVFDTGALGHGPIEYADLGKLNRWLGHIAEIGRVYTAAARQNRDAGIFAAEIGRFSDAGVAVVGAMADCVMAERAAHSDSTPTAADEARLTKLRDNAIGAIAGIIGMLRAPGLTVVWVRERLNALTAAAPSLARILTPAQLVRLRGTTLQLTAELHDKKLRPMFDRLAVALAEPPPPLGPPSIAVAGNEIALEANGHSYLVSGRVNGVVTAQFILDSGAGYVALPQDVIDDLMKAGALAQSDWLGRDTYVAADGKRHHGKGLMLRQLDVGGHTVANVRASVIPAHSRPLLGLSFLAKFKSWTLDNQRHVLVVSE